MSGQEARNGNRLAFRINNPANSIRNHQVDGGRDEEEAKGRDQRRPFRRCLVDYAFSAQGVKLSKKAGKLHPDIDRSVTQAILVLRRSHRVLGDERPLRRCATDTKVPHPSSLQGDNRSKIW